ncbi:hypothetical protein HPB52_012229 [Rhipicephalus sanguineus]|uniref:Uncharacterized protein n=1 Tax=Rhipicephalus sanguineus TaxID=34632 RepID=A0A9D4SQ50_RHISA|nr:hypothetical protein HPB52_012229 [Rhipicephalus sanguineus]
MKPKQGLIVRDFTNHQVARAVAAACGNNEVCRDEDILIRLRNGSNIIIASMPQKEAANRLRRITKLTLVIKSYEVNTYVATPDGVVRGVVHGIDAGTPSEELMAHLRVRTQGVKILQARMLGKSKTAVITFEGKVYRVQISPEKGKTPAQSQPGKNGVRNTRRSRKDSSDGKNKRRWFSSKRDNSASRSRSRSRWTSTTRQQQDESNPNRGKKKNKKTRNVGWADIAADSNAPANTHTIQAINKCNECASIRRQLEVMRAKYNELTRKVDNLMKAIKERDTNVDGHGGMRAAAAKENSGKDVHVTQATALWVDQTAFMKNAQTTNPPLTGYAAYLSQTEGKATTLVFKAITAIQHPALDTDIEHVLTEVIPHERAEQYAQELSKQNWNEFCDSLKGTLGTAKTLALLRNMIDPTKSKTETKTLHRIAHNFQGNDAELLGKISERYNGSVNIAAGTDPYRESDCDDAPPLTVKNPGNGSSRRIATDCQS